MSDEPSSKIDYKSLFPIAVAVVTAAGSLAVSQYRVGQVETWVSDLKDNPVKLVLLERDVKLLRCEIRNVKRIIRNQAENDCD
jgi:hypothetical protein